MAFAHCVTKRFGILTAGGDCPGLNAAIRAVCRAAHDRYGMEIVGIANGFRGLLYDDTKVLHPNDFSGILTQGGTILGSSREKPYGPATSEKDEVAGEKVSAIMETYSRLKLDCLVLLGGNGTNTTGSKLSREGLNIIGLPKTIDNDIAGTDRTFGFHSALSIGTEAIDRLHSTAQSHSRVIVIELMGNKAGWLALYAGVAGGGDIILLPEIPYDMRIIARHLEKRAESGKTFSIVVAAEGAMSVKEAEMDKKDRKKYRIETGPSAAY
ncbi:MAG: ATP-dependent 6-phosphofructokinase, partial [Treponema sp.]|nr:ATP-dependent 6-phosphofructokinase [Treponema sp.]